MFKYVTQCPQVKACEKLSTFLNVLNYVESQLQYRRLVFFRLFLLWNSCPDGSNSRNSVPNFELEI
jgi:hypothetical protein